MKTNEGTLDRVIRVILGVALAALGLFGVVSGALMYVFYALAAILIITAAIGFCPLWAIFKVNTAKK
jgi:Inner membrane protein YgaP-like, transmembrane domain